MPVASAWASFDGKWSNADVAGTIDPSLKNEWNVWGRTGQAHQAVFLLNEPAPAKDRRFVIELRNGKDANLGRFRLSVTGDPGALERDETRLAVLKVKVADPWTKLGAAYALNGCHDEALRFLDKAHERAEGYEARKPILELAARFDDIISALAQRQAADPQLQMALARNLANRGRRQLAEKQPAKAQADLEKSREIFTRLRAASRWTVLTPTEMKSEQGATLTTLDDVLAELHRRLPNDKAIQDAYLKAVDKAAAEFSKKLDALPDRPEAWAERSQLILSVIRRRDDVFERLVKLRPKDSLLPVCVARELVLKSDWQGAEAAYAKIVETLPLSEEWYEYAAVLLLANKTKEYSEFMKRVAAKAGDPLDSFVAYSLSRAAAISPTSAVPPEKAVRWAERALGDAKNSWFPHSAGLAYLRAGNLEQALKLLGKSLATPWCPQFNHLALALVHAQRKDAAGAHEHLKWAEKWFQDQASQKTNGYFDGQVTDWLEANLLLREAKAVIE